ncbi:hypothetical protein GSI_05157 [Ganoderma sinense ZZ0214-1]|uniref:Uncharacterized protein n=1 Tax=Ganoderma sinense ZZ0214-1 TaxID=1077348 RepID=A0A2G8SF96_9APHY|nr:hypothetical protein GSI_05157 [Ganoderma sinense ZZ0214-1]
MSDNVHNEKQSSANSSGESPGLSPSRPHKNLRSVSPPLAHIPFRRFVYYVATFAILVIAFYGWHMFHWYGGWWNLALGWRHPGARTTPTPTAGTASAQYTGNWKAAEGSTKSVEDSIQALADALGMPSSDLASAIADAVREHVPPASLSSVAVHEPSGTAVQHFVNSNAAADGGQAGTVGTVGTVRSAFDAAVGMDEPPNDLGGE